VSFSHRIIVVSLKAITNLVCRIDDAEVVHIPQNGPLIIYTNHVNILEIPIIFTCLQPRRAHGVILAERWNNPILQWMLEVTETIPLHRGEPDIVAIRRGLKVLKKGEIIVIAPEGTRSHDGKLQLAHAGVVLLALHSHAPLLPVAYYGAEKYKENLSQLKRCDFYIRVGTPFHLDERGKKVTHVEREKMLDEMMHQLANLLPEKYRGYYAQAQATEQKYLVFK